MTEVYEKAQKKFRGKTLEELKNLDIREFAKYLKSRERRSLLRQFDVVAKFIKKCEKNASEGKPIKTHNRDLVIMPHMVDLTIGVHNGKEYVPVKISFEMLGHRLGEFAITRKKVEHSAPGIGATRSSAALSVK